MNKRLGILVLILMMVTLTACGGANGAETPAEPAAAIEKDVTMLLKSIGDSMDMVKSLGDLPEAQVNGNLYYYQNTENAGYFAGFDLGVETQADGTTVKQIYIQPIGDAKITANDMVVGGTVSDAKAVFGDGALSSVDQNGKIVNFLTFADEKYEMKATVKDDRITAVAFTAASGDSAKPSETTASNPGDAESGSESESSTSAPQTSSISDAEAEELSHSMDYLMDFVGQNFEVVEDELGSDYTKDQNEFEDLVVYEESPISIAFSVDYETNVVTALLITFDETYAEVETHVGMAGFVLGAPLPDTYEEPVACGPNDLFVMSDVNNMICGLQVLGGMPMDYDEPESETSADDGAYELVIDNFDTYSILSLKYLESGKKVELVNTKGRWDGDQFFDGFDVKILDAKASKDGKTVYFGTDDPKMTNGYGASNNTILKYDIAGGYEEHVCLGFLYDTVKVPGYEDCIIIEYFEPSPRGGYYQPYILIDGDTNYHFMGKELEADLADQVRRAYNGEIDELAVMTPASENINGKYIDFSKYSIVVAEDYQGINTGRMESMTIQNPYYKDQGQSLFPCNFAVFGTIYNLRWEVGINMDESKVYPIADQLTDTLVTYETWRPYDPSTDTFWFEDVNGNEYRIVIEDMSDNIDLVTVP